MKNLLLLFSISIFCLTNLYTQQLEHVLGEIIIQVRFGEDIRKIAKNLSRQNGIPTGLQLKRELSPPLRIWLIEFDFSKINEDHFLQKIRNMREVENAQFNHLGDYRQTIPDDPAFDQQWMWLNTGQTGGLADADIDLDLAWDLTTGGQTADGQEIVVCVVEGANRNHPDLQGNLWFNEAEVDGDGIDNDSNGYVDDYAGWHVNINNDNVNDNSFGHGTFVSGIIGAKGNNGLMVSGVNWNIKIMHVDFSGVSEANSIAAYTYPLIMRKKYNESGGANGAFVVATNSSWGIDGGDPSDSPIWCAMYDSLGQIGILSCGATTNDNANVDIVGDLPTACKSEYLIAVTATNDEDLRTFSGYGIENVDVAAPGDNVVSINLNGGPTNSSGTSFSTPIVAGLVALLYSAPCSSLGAQALGAPAATAEFIRDAIYQGVDKIPNLANEVKYGGRVNAINSMETVMANCGPCPKPFGIHISYYDDISGTAEWFSTDSTLTTTMRFRQVGNPNWQIFQNAVTPFMFSDLSACTKYEFQLDDNCASESSGFTNPFIFQTDGCCVYPDELTVLDFDETTAAVVWNPIFAAKSYNIQLVSPSGNILYENITSTAFEFYGLDSCTFYGVQVQTVCDTGMTNFSLPVQFKTNGCGNCTDLPYCLSFSSDSNEEWIAKVSINSLENISSSNDGYGEFTYLTTDLMTFQTYQISLVPGFAGFGYNEWFKVFIDFNQDGDFNDTDEQVFDAGGASNDPVQGEVFVPGDAIEGSTRMRVVMKWNSPPNSCEAGIEHGEVEDYCVYIIEGQPINCDIPQELAVFNIAPHDADFSWKNSAEALSYEVRIKSEVAQNWLVVVSQDTFFTALNLIDCTDYESQVRTVCSGTKSDWSASTFFTTECIIGAVNIDHDFEFWSISPNPFNENLSVNFKLQNSTQIGFELIDMNGRILLKTEKEYGVGEYYIDIFPNGNQLPTGIYFLKVKNGDNFSVKKVLRF